eukprot:scpid81620/ scgid13808/ 
MSTSRSESSSKRRRRSPCKYSIRIEILSTSRDRSGSKPRRRSLCKYSIPIETISTSRGRSGRKRRRRSQSESSPTLSCQTRSERGSHDAMRMSRRLRRKDGREQRRAIRHLERFKRRLLRTMHGSAAQGRNRSHPLPDLSTETGEDELNEQRTDLEQIACRLFLHAETLFKSTTETPRVASGGFEDELQTSPVDVSAETGEELQDLPELQRNLDGLSLAAEALRRTATPSVAPGGLNEELWTEPMDVPAADTGKEFDDLPKLQGNSAGLSLRGSGENNM